MPIIKIDNLNFDWFSVNVDGQGSLSNAYFGFDQIYISDASCYCPVVWDISDSSFSDIQTVSAQEYLNLVTNNSVITDGTNSVNVTFTAGSAIVVTPGFNTQLGVTAEMKIASCFSNTPEAAFTIQNPYPVCDNLVGGNLNFCFKTKNITKFSFQLTDLLGDVNYIPYTTGEINTGITDADGFNVTCFTIPDIEDQYVECAFNGIGCNGASISRSARIFMGDCDGKSSFFTDDTTPKQTENNTIKIYPDPFCSSVTIKNTSFSAGDIVNIMDATGRIISKINISEAITKVNLNDVQTGIYFIGYSGSNVSLTQKLTKVCE